jgi:hypothetical protein
MRSRPAPPTRRTSHRRPSRAPGNGGASLYNPAGDTRPILLDLTPSGWKVLAMLDTGPVTAWYVQKEDGRKLTLAQEADNGYHDVDYQWDGTKFVRLT